ncbi:MAG TPA: hypothetical protein ENK14_08625 [Caldithrix sp.]|nr:hypothetical protein [Caldithrix sp.]
MIVLRLLPVILSALLLAAHFLRFYGVESAVVVILLLLTLLIRKRWVLRMWQFFLFLGALIWIQTTVTLIQFRIALDLPWLRLAAIMGAVILFTTFSGIWLENKKIKRYFQNKIEKP